LTTLTTERCAELGRRALAMGVVDASGHTGFALPDFCSLGEIFSLASATQVSCQVEVVSAGASAGTATGSSSGRFSE
jgi:hypothetical protein